MASLADFDEEGLSRLAYEASWATWPWSSISTILFILRAIARFQISRYSRDVLGWDDILLSLSWIFNIIRAVGFQIGLSASQNINPSDLPNTAPNPLFWIIFSNDMSYPSISTPKMAVAVLICRTFCPRRWLRISISTFCAVTYIMALLGFVLSFVQCSPVVAQWDLWTYPRSKCWDQMMQVAYAVVMGSLSAFLDIAFAAYPGFVIWNLNMSRRRKLNIMALMGVGILSFGFAMKKLYTVTKLLKSEGFDKFLDDSITIGIWSSIENDFVFGAACVPGIPPVFRSCRNFVKSHTSSSGDTSLNHSSDRYYGKDSSRAVELDNRETWEAPGSRGEGSIPIRPSECI